MTACYSVAGSKPEVNRSADCRLQVDLTVVSFDTLMYELHNQIMRFTTVFLLFLHCHECVVVSQSKCSQQN
jgi:hypothetical protein